MANNLKISYHSIDFRIAYIHRMIGDYRSLIKNFRVLDVGGTAGSGWSSSLADLTLDINANTDGKSIHFDICNETDWNRLEAKVDQDGKFDYAICTHTLEDVYDPIVTLKNLPLIAKQGIITMPSIYTELSNVESSFYLGYIHHRWIFEQEDGKMLVVPKLGMLEALARGKHQFKPEAEEIWFEWEDDIPYKIFMDNYLGPDARSVTQNYSKLINI